ncbi:hypothetical protein FAZ24_04575 (plasmid) [Klebsiella pneumoniae]|nr:hypothetical protein FAZ24_04575 [Klebsiella pneumoniae]
MKLKGYVAALPALLLTGCAMLPGQPTDYDRFCNVSGIASHGETYRVSDSQDFWLTPNGRYLSQAEYSSPADTLQKLTGVVSGEDPDQVRKNAVRVRVFRVESESGHKGACLPVRYDDKNARRKMDSLTNGRRMMVYSEDEGQSGQQIYNNSRGAGFSYRLL